MTDVQKRSTPRRFRSLANTLIRSIAVAGALCTLAVATLQIALTYREHRRNFEAEVGSIARVNVPLLSVNLWDIEPDALAWGERCTPPLQENEVLRCLDSLAKRHEARSVVAISGTTHHNPQEMERHSPGAGKEGINSTAVQAIGLEPDRPDFIPSFQAEAEAEAGITGDLIPSFQAAGDEQLLLHRCKPTPSADGGCDRAAGLFDGRFAAKARSQSHADDRQDRLAHRR